MSGPADNSIVAAWVEKADHDLGTARLVLQYKPDYYDTVAFHCQQAVEKYLKALLVHFEIEFTKTHDLPYLLELLSAGYPVDTGLYDKAIELNGYAVEIRYPGAGIHLSKDELEIALATAGEFQQLAVKMLH